MSNDVKNVRKSGFRLFNVGGRSKRIFQIAYRTINRLFSFFGDIIRSIIGR